MARPAPNTIRSSDIVGLKNFSRLIPLLERLHDIGAQGDRAPFAFADFSILPMSI